MERVKERKERKRGEVEKLRQQIREKKKYSV